MSTLLANPLILIHKDSTFSFLNPIPTTSKHYYKKPRCHPFWRACSLSFPFYFELGNMEKVVVFQDFECTKRPLWPCLLPHGACPHHCLWVYFSSAHSCQSQSWWCHYKNCLFPVQFWIVWMSWADFRLELLPAFTCWWGDHWCELLNSA